MEVIKYSSVRKNEWDSFVRKAKNSHFMFLRTYMEYHSDRFKDESLLFYKKQKLVAILPAHLEGTTLATHNGLTFGGVLCDESMTFSLMEEVFTGLKEYLTAKGIFSLFYKAIPACYHQIPACEDLAVLTQLGAEILERDLVSVVDLKADVKYYKGVRWSIQKAKQANLQVKETKDFFSFMQIMSDVLSERYNLKTAHSIQEIERLATEFPENIVLVGIFEGDEILGGSLLYLTEKVVHAQYIGMTSRGKKLLATPLLLDSIFKAYKGEKEFFSFGTSQGGKYINEKLYYFKESMGARAMLQEQYVLSLK